MVLVPKTNKPVASHHKKRSGDHHKRSKPYHQTYWPYLPLLAIAGFALLLNITWSGLGVRAGNVLGASTGLNSQQLLDDTNQDRAKLGINTLNLDVRLSAAAQAKAQDMASHNYWSHTSPSGKQPWSFVTDAGYTYRALGENLAYGFTDPAGVIDGWMSSPEHRTNMLDPAYRNVGFGVVTAASYQGKASQTIVVAMYGSPAKDFGVVATVDNPTALPARTVARSEQLTGISAPWINVILVATAVAMFVYFMSRHVKFAHRALVYSEAFIIKHPHLDLLVITVGALSILLSRTAGFIH